MTDTRFGRQTAISYAALQLNLGSRYTTVYTLVDPDKTVPLRKATVAFDTATKKIHVLLMRLAGKDTVFDQRDFAYRDSLGLLFTPQNTLVEQFDIEPAPLFAFASELRTYVNILTVDETGRNAERRYRFDEPTEEQIDANAAWLKANLKTVSGVAAPLATAEPKQTPRENPPLAPPLPRAAANQSFFFTDNVETVVRPSSRDVVELCVLFRGGVSNYDVFKQGIEWVALNTAVYGASRNAGADQMAQAFARAGMRIELEFATDHSRLVCTFPLASWDESWKMLGDVLLRTAFAEEDFEAARSELVALNTPSTNLLSQGAFDAGLKDAFALRHLDKSPYGSLAPLSAMTHADARRYFQSLVTRSRITLAVSGNVTPEMVKKKVASEWKTMPAGSYGDYPVQVFEPLSSSFKTLAEPPTPQNIVTLIAAAPKPFTAEAVAFEIGLQVLENRMRQTAMDQRRLVSRLGVHYLVGKQPIALIQFESADPDKAMQAVLDELKRIKKLGADESEIKAARHAWLSNFYFGLTEGTALVETAALLVYFNQADFIDNADEMAKRVKNDAVAAALKRYTKGFKIYLTGNPEAANPIIYTQKTEF